MKWASILLGLLTLPLIFNFAPLEVMRLKTFDALVTTPEPSEALSPFIVDPTWLQSELLYLNNRKDPELASPLPSL